MGVPRFRHRYCDEYTHNALLATFPYCKDLLSAFTLKDSIKWAFQSSLSVLKFCMALMHMVGFQTGHLNVDNNS